MFSNRLRLSGSLCAAVLFFAFPLAAQTTPRRSAGASLLRDLNASVEDLTARVSMSVVQVLVTGYGAVDERASGGETGLVIGRQRRELSRYAAGDSVTLALLRGTAAMSMNITVRERPHPVDELAGLADPEKSAIAKLGSSASTSGTPRAVTWTCRRRVVVFAGLASLRHRGVRRHGFTTEQRSNREKQKREKRQRKKFCTF